MAMRPADGRNPVKTAMNAKETKKNMGVAKSMERDDWRKKIEPRAKKLDAEAAKISKGLEALKKSVKKANDHHEEVEKIKEINELREQVEHLMHHLLEEAEEMAKEIETYCEVRIGQPTPKMPHGHMLTAEVLAFGLTLLGFWIRLRRKMK